MKYLGLVLPPLLVMVLIGCTSVATPVRPSNPPPKKTAVFQAPPPPVAKAGVDIIRRDKWAQVAPILSDINPMGRIGRITVHHEAELCEEGDWTSSVLRIRGIQKAHMQKGWADIGYHFMIDYKGRIWEGRLLKYQGAHVRDNNEGNIGIALLGDFNIQWPTKEQKESLKRLLNELRTTYNVPKRRVYTHRELVVTECPGDHLQSYVNELRR